MFCRMLTFLEKLFQEYHQSVKQFAFRSGPMFFDLGQKCSQSLPADDASAQRACISMDTPAWTFKGICTYAISTRISFAGSSV